MEKPLDVIVYGTVALDMIWRLADLPPRNGYTSIQTELKTIGGEAANTTMALHKWDVRVGLVGTATGEDVDGRLLRELFAIHAPDLDLDHVRTLPDVHTPLCLCLAAADGSRTLIGRGFEEMQQPILTPELAASARFFTMEPNGWEAAKRAALVAMDAGTPVIAMDMTTNAEISSRAFVNLTSLDTLGTGQEWQEMEAEATRLRDTYGQTAIITCGANGCFLATKEASGMAVHFPAFPVEVVDSTGAGDTFRAGLLFGLLQKWDWSRTIQFASATAALNCQALGGWCGVRSVAHIEAFISASNPPLESDP